MLLEKLYNVKKKMIEVTQELLNHDYLCCLEDVFCAMRDINSVIEIVKILERNDEK